MYPRAIAAQVVHQVIYFQRSLSVVLKNIHPSDDKTLIKELCFGTLRWFHRLEAIANRLLIKPIKTKDRIIFCLLLIGLYQLIYMHTPHYAAVSETVSASKYINKSWAAALLNKTLRRFINEQQKILNDIDKIQVARFSHPQWLIDKIKQDWPKDWENILLENNQHPPMFLRVNHLKISRDNYLKLLLQHDIAAEIVPDLENAIQLAKPLPVDDIMGFHEGFCSVQDGSSQKIVDLLDLKPGQSVLDACAAPGGKTSHILETESTIKKLIAIDSDPERLNKVKKNIVRLQLDHSHFRLVLADANHTKEWWDGHLFDRILLDAPCSGTGVIRRHPDIKILRQPEDIEKIAQQQLHLLNSLWPLLRPNGKLLYTTCSILLQENEGTVSRFLHKRHNAKIILIPKNWGHHLSHGNQLLPGEKNLDGFYYAVIKKL